MKLSDGRFSAQHCLFYALNAFLGPDLGPFAEWLTSEALGLGKAFGSLAMMFVHHPFYYVLLLGAPLTVFYSWFSRFLLERGLLETGSGASLSRRQCLLLVAAGSLTHFFLDHLFEENGRTSMYSWILSTGWWRGRAPIYPDAVLVIGVLCTSLLACFIHINRTTPFKSISVKSRQSMVLILLFIILYCLWCGAQLYWRNPPHPAIGEEADLGVLVFLSVFFFLPHSFCIFSMHHKAYQEMSVHLPL